MLFVVPCVIALQALGPLGAVALGIPAFAIAVPWLVTVHLVQAFASRIAVLENRHALDAIGKARLFLHGRLRHGLTLIVATFVGSLLIVFAGLVVVVPVALLLVALIPVLRSSPSSSWGVSCCCRRSTCLPQPSGRFGPRSGRSAT